jgi:hypothetical protein
MSKKKDTLQTDLFPNLIEKPKKPLNEFQTRNFLYMIDRIRSYRFSKLGEARRLEEKELDKLPKPTMNDIIRLIKNGKLVPQKRNNRNNRDCSIEYSGSALYNEEKNQTEGGYHITFSVKEIPTFKALEVEQNKIAERWKEQERLDNERIAGIKIKLRLGHIDSETAENFVNELMAEWEVPITIVAEANHTNASCAR